MVVIYAEKASLAKEIASALHAGKRIAHPKEPTIGHYEFIFKDEKAIYDGACSSTDGIIHKL